MVVTASADGTDAFGFTDFAIGNFPADVDLIGGAQQVITGAWADQAADGQERWGLSVRGGIGQRRSS